MTYFNQALPIVREVRDRSGEATTLNNIGAVYRDTNQPKLAITNWQQSVEITLQMRGSLQRTNRQQFLESNQGSAIALVDLLIDQKQPERAYEWINLSTTADLADYSRLINAKVSNPDAQQAIDQWNQKNQRLESLRQQLQAKFSETLVRQVNDLQAEVNKQAEDISRRFPEVAELFETTPTDIAQLRANIPNGTVIIQPVLLTGIKTVKNTIALFVITKDKLSVCKEAIDPKQFDQLLATYSNQLRTRSTNEFQKNSKQLYDILIRPVESQIQANSPKQLSIIATGKLRYIPFETLIDKNTNQYLIQKYPVNNLTRLSTHALQKTKNNGNYSLLGLGNPVPNDIDNLDGAEAEVKEIAQLLPGSATYLGNSATLSTFKTQSQRFSLLHLATHGCFRTEGCPGLKLPANTLLFADQTLNIADAALLGLKNTELIVLSACQTAIGTNSNGEEVAGIAYLFERAGASAVIPTLWSVNDEGTRELMVEFYKNLKSGITKGEALRQAKIKLIRSGTSFQHPYYWSPFILIGDAR